METVIKNYLDALSKGDYHAIIHLFAPDARVVSPLYGTLSAKVFYEDLLGDTNSSRIELLDVFTNVARSTAAVNFIYHWTMADGSQSSFDCVDLFDFDDQLKIKQLKIIYDTVHTRPAFEQQKN